MILDYLDTSRELSDLVTRDWLGKHARAWVRRSLTDVPTTQGLRLVRRLAEHGALDSTGVITEIKPNLLGLSSRANRWPLIAEAHDVAPAAFSDSEWSSLRNEIAKDLEEMLTDAAGYFEEVSELEDFANAAEQMGVDVEGEIYATAFEEVEIAVAEREGEEESRDDPDYDGEEFREIRGGGNEDADIDAMFDRLLD